SGTNLSRRREIPGAVERLLLGRHGTPGKTAISGAPRAERPSGWLRAAGDERGSLGPFSRAGDQTMPDDRDQDSKGRFRKGNKASMSSGLRHGLSLCRLPKGCSSIARSLRVLRRRLEDATRAQHGGELTVRHIGLINRAVMCERRSRLIQRWQEQKWE